MRWVELLVGFIIGVGVNKSLLYRINNDINMLLIIQSLPSSFKIQNIKDLNLVLRYFLSLSLSPLLVYVKEEGSYYSLLLSH